MGRIVFSDFISVYNMMLNDREEYIKNQVVEPDQDQENDEENIEVQANYLFRSDSAHDEEDQVGSSSSSGHAPRSLKSYPPERTEGMKERAQAELEAIPRPLSSTWLIKQRSLKTGIAGLQFFADPELNSLLIQVLERKDCLDSPTRAVRAVARIFWSDEEMLSMHLRRGYHPSSHPRSSLPPDRETLPHSSDLHDLFMILHQIADVDLWLSCGKHVWLYNTLYSFRQGLLRQQEKSAGSGGEGGPKRRIRRSGSVNSPDAASERKRFKTEDETSVSSSDTYVE